MFGGYMSGRAGKGIGKAFRITTSFTTGMIITSAIVGMIAAVIDQSLIQLFTVYEQQKWIPAIVSLVMGLQLLGFIRLIMPNTLHVQPKNPKTLLGSFSLGLPFRLVITP